METPQPVLPVEHYFGKLIGFAAGFLIDAGTMPWAGAALGEIVDTIHYNFVIRADRSKRVKLPALAVIIVGGTACAYAIFFLYPTDFVGDGGRIVLNRVADAIAVVLPAVGTSGRTVRSLLASGASEVAGAFRAAIAISWLVVATLTAAFFAAGVFPGERNFCRHIAAKRPDKIHQTAASFFAFSIFLLLVAFSGFNTFVASNGLVYMDERHYARIVSLISLAPVMSPLALFLMFASTTLLRSHYVSGRNS
jgi:hypothetical protein